MKALSKLFDILGKIIAIVWLLAFVLWVTNANWGYLDTIPVLVKILSIIKEWGALLLVAVVGFEAASRKIWLLIPFLIILAACIIFMFFPGATDAIFNLVK